MSWSVRQTELALATLMVLVTPSKAVTRASLPEIVKEIQRSICPVGVIRTDLSGKNHFVIEGTGFFVGAEGRFVTALHVARAVQDAIETQPLQRAAVCVPYDGWPRGDETAPLWCAGFKIINSDAQNDLALCLTERNPFADPKTKHFVHPAVLDATLPPDGTEVIFIGFPSSNAVPMTFRGFVSSYQDIARGKESGPLFLIQGSDLPGMSGGPLCLPNGHVIGLVLGSGTQRFATLTGARPTRFISSLLKGPKTGY